MRIRNCHRIYLQLLALAVRTGLHSHHARIMLIRWTRHKSEYINKAFTGTTDQQRRAKTILMYDWRSISVTERNLFGSRTRRKKNQHHVPEACWEPVPDSDKEHGRWACWRSASSLAEAQRKRSWCVYWGLDLWGLCAIWDLFVLQFSAPKVASKELIKVDGAINDQHTMPEKVWKL